MKALGLASLVIALAVVVNAQGGDDAALKKEKAAFQGVWKVINLETAQGKDTNADGAMLEFGQDGKSLTYSHQGNTKKATFTINIAAKPKEIDIKPIDEDKTFEGIYHLEKDTLKLCLAMGPGDGRPGEFAAKEGKSFAFVTLERNK